VYDSSTIPQRKTSEARSSGLSLAAMKVGTPSTSVRCRVGSTLET
jgi:hypothetical protein